jgi:hypothetical protein
MKLTKKYFPVYDEYNTVENSYRSDINRTNGFDTPEEAFRVGVENPKITKKDTDGMILFIQTFQKKVAEYYVEKS